MSDTVYRLPGGTEDNDLWAFRDEDSNGTAVARSVWVPTDEERARIAAGENIELLCWGAQIPMQIVDVPLGAPPRPVEVTE